MKQVFHWADLKRLVALPFQEKLAQTEEMIDIELSRSAKPCVAWSTGKASTVLLHMVLARAPGAIVVFHNTGVQYKETYEYRDLLLQTWGIENYHETKPSMSFWHCVRKYGYPQFRNKNTRTPRCCYYLKEKPARQLIKAEGVDLEFVGLQATESMVRRLSFFREGFNFQSKSYGCRISRPLMCWRDSDIWDYFKKFELPLNPIYKKMKRNGCAACTGFKGWRRLMVKVNPKMYAFISRQLGQTLLADYGCKGDLGYS